MSKYDYLKTEHWLKLRREIRKLRKNCEICHTTTKLHVHHRHYKTVGRENPEDIYLICEKHHYRLHKIAKRRHISYDQAYEIVKRIYDTKEDHQFGINNTGKKEYLKRKYEIRKEKKIKLSVKIFRGKKILSFQQKKNHAKELLATRNKIKALREIRLKMWDNSH